MLAISGVLWEMSTLERVVVGAGDDLRDLAAPRWVFVESGSVVLETATARECVGPGDALLLGADLPSRVRASEDSVVAVADLRARRAVLPGVVLVRCFATRHPGLAGLVAGCPQQSPGAVPSQFTESYGNLIAAAMTASWREDRGEEVERDAAVEAVVAEVSGRLGECWTVARMAALVYLSRSARWVSGSAGR